MNVEKLYKFPKKGKKAVSVDKCNLQKDIGMEGDFHGKGVDRQITLVSAKAEQWMKEEKPTGLCFGKLGVNVVVSESCASFQAGDEVKIGEASVRIIDSRKRCYPELCMRVMQNLECMLTEEILFAEVLNGGAVAVGDICEGVSGRFAD
ncbi:MAG: hypothetical protein PHC41_14755 [Lachnospiraceae bacterium]|nr:hypothetical protein [Lachnospiraceae bacterium]MDD3617466.1 hypothetical protein [Lachnospiraceae bacterium]